MSKKHKKGKTSPAKKAANQNNAQQSTGPKTPEGKATVSQNAQKHGLTGLTFKLLAWEDPEAYEAFKAKTFAEYAPQTTGQEALVLKIVQYSWKVLRAFTLEAEEIEKSEAAGDYHTSKIMERYRRYVVSTERLIQQAKQELEFLQAPETTDVTHPKLLEQQKALLAKDRKAYLKEYERRLEAMCAPMPPMDLATSLARWEEYKASLPPERRTLIKE